MITSRCGCASITAAKQSSSAGLHGQPVRLAREAFIAFAKARADTGTANPERAAVLYLACACLEKVPPPPSPSSLDLRGAHPHYLGRLARKHDCGLSAADPVFICCIVGDEAICRLSTDTAADRFTRGWVWATAVREALAQNRGSERMPSDMEAALEERAFMPWADPENPR